MDLLTTYSASYVREPKIYFKYSAYTNTMNQELRTIR